MLCAITFAGGVLTPLHAYADGTQPLPGVEQPAPIVQAPLPEPDDQPSATPGTFKAGNFDVRVSGSITVDIGVGNIKPPR